MKKPPTTTRRNGTVRCAIYTRKSSEEGLEQEFNSLQAQREACEAFIDSQRHEGWVCQRAPGGIAFDRTPAAPPRASRRAPPRSARRGPSTRPCAPCRIVARCARETLATSRLVRDVAGQHLIG